MVNIDLDNFTEKELFRIFSDAVNKTLEVKKFKKWCKKNYHIIDSWLNNILDMAQLELCKKGLITEVTKEKKGIFGKTKTIRKKIITPELVEEAIKLKGLKKFLLDFSTMPEKEIIDVHLWEDYLVFAQLFGIAKKVEKQFSEIYPDFNKQAILNTDITMVVASRMSNICYSEMKVGRRIHNASTILSDISSSGYSSGGGGHSYSSGGHSSGGSSGGGFR